ncbi:MAG: alpha/beta fold hydrolase [Anaerolineae bacterium]
MSAHLFLWDNVISDASGVDTLIVDRWADNHNIRLHYLDAETNSTDMSLVCIPGLSSDAESFRPTIEALLPRRGLSLSLRGRGKSDIPEVGYRFEDHVEDVAAIIEHSGLKRTCLMGHSIGVNYAIGYALNYPNRVSGLIIGGYPAEYPTFTADWALRVMMKYPNEMPMKAVLGIQYESKEISLWERLNELSCPILVLRGAKSTSLLREDIAAKVCGICTAKQNCGI